MHLLSMLQERFSHEIEYQWATIKFEYLQIEILSFYLKINRFKKFKFIYSKHRQFFITTKNFENVDRFVRTFEVIQMEMMEKKRIDDAHCW